MKNSDYKLILASGSPRRRELLVEAGYRFEVIVPDVDEALGACSNCGPAELVSVLAERKAAEVVSRLRREAENLQLAAWADYLIACDTVAECRGEILGKPVDEDHARRMLKMLSGSQHRVYTALCVWPLRQAAATTRVAVTTLRMDPLEDDQLEAYLASDQWQGKAGGFGYQDQLGWIHIIEGSESNVVGLPLELLDEMLRQCAQA